jgi:hypothetical protein
MSEFNNAMINEHLEAMIRLVRPDKLDEFGVHMEGFVHEVTQKVVNATAYEFEKTITKLA